MNEGLVAEAVEEAAQAGDRSIEGGFSIDAKAASSARRIAAARNIIMRFLDNVPDEITVMELRDALDAA